MQNKNNNAQEVINQIVEGIQDNKVVAYAVSEFQHINNNNFLTFFILNTFYNLVYNLLSVVVLVLHI